MLGLAAVLHASALAFSALKWCGVIYLLYMAWQTLRERGALAVDTRVEARSNAPGDRDGFPDQHPQSESCRSSSWPSCRNSSRPTKAIRWRGCWNYRGAFMAMTFVVFVLYGLFAASVRDRVISRPKVMRWLRRAFAGGFAVLGARLAFAER